MTTFTYNDIEFSVEQAQGRWNIRYRRPDGTPVFVAAGLFASVSGDEIEAKARELTQSIFPVGIRIVGPDVAHPNLIGDLKIVGPDVTHPNFIHWDKDSSSFPK
jgi:hypothetical protein